MRNLRYGSIILIGGLSGDKFLHYLFDLTTTAQWQGAAVGIVRVEQELARRGRHHLGNNLAFCIYDRAQSVVRILEDELADDLIGGRVRVDFVEQPDSVPPSPPVVRSSLRRLIRAALLRNSTVYYMAQRMRGSHLTREQVLNIRARELGQTTAEQVLEATAIAPGQSEAIPLEQLRHRPTQLDTQTTIISGGLDWQYKDLRALWALKQRHGFSYCAIVYDLIPLRFPHFVPSSYVELLTEYFGELTWLADHAMCISETTKQDWVRHACEIGAEPTPSSVFPLGCDIPRNAKSLPSQLPSALHGKQFAMYVSTIEPRKNHRMLYEAWEECVRTGQVDPTQHRLVFVGRKGWLFGDMLHQIETNPLTRDTIVLLHETSDEVLASLYQACSFVVFPTLYEGFGLPLAEALANGKLCVASNAAALSEIGGDLIMKLDPKDTIAWSNTIGRLMSSPSEVRAWEDCIKRHYRPTTWDNAARIFFNTVSAFSCGRRSVASSPVFALQ